MFHTTKLRTAVALLAAASTVAAVAPAASASKHIPGRFNKSSEGQRLKQQQDKCQNLKLTYDNWGTLIDVDLQNGNSADANKDLDSQTQTYDYAKSQGCAWAY
jgi:Spy/CpxP family protein refolding chaperone